MPNEAREAIGLPQHPDGDTPFIMSSRQAADAASNVSGNRERDSSRANNQSDGTATVSGRNPKGEGRASQ